MDLKSVTKINLSTDLFRKIFRNLSWVFFLAFLVLLVFEGFEVNKSVSLVLQVNQTPAVSATASGSHTNRIDFNAYNAAVQRIQSGQTFIASTTIANDPFSVTGTQAP